MHALRFAVLWWLALAGWWLLLVGTNAGLEELAGACAATLGTVLALAIRRRRLLVFRFERRWLARASLAPVRMVQETGIVLWALALHLRPPTRPTDRGARRARAREHGGDRRPRAARRRVRPLVLLRPAAGAGRAELRRDARLRPVPGGPVAVTIDILVALGVTAQLASCVGLLAMRTAIDRLHYAGAATGVGPALIAAAVCVREGFFTSNGLNAVVVAVLLALLGAELSTATARAIRLRERGTLKASGAA